MSKLSFRQKLWLPLAFSLIALTLMSVFNAYQRAGFASRNAGTTWSA